MRIFQFFAAFWGVCCISAGAQTFTLGTPQDPCTGGNPLTIANSTSTLRYGDFTCTFSVAADGLYTVEFDFFEPCAQPGACAAGQVTQAGQRLENLFVNSQPVLWNYDPFADIYQGVQLNPPTTSGQRLFLIYSHYSQFSIKVQTVVRSAVLAAVVIAPAQLIGVGGITITRSQCIGSGPGWNCAGLELYQINSKPFIASVATPPETSLPNCPVVSGACWKPAVLGK